MSILENPYVPIFREIRKIRTVQNNHKRFLRGARCYGRFSSSTDISPITEPIQLKIGTIIGVYIHKISTNFEPNCFSY